MTCPQCTSPTVTRQGRDATQPARQKYECHACRQRFDDLTGTIFAGHRPPSRAWILCLSFPGLNLSKEPIANELDLHGDEAQKMTSPLREGIVERTPEVTLSGAVECDEDMVAGPKGHLEAAKKGRTGRRRRLKGEQGRGTLAKEKPPTVCMIPRTGAVAIRMQEEVRPVTIAPLIRRTIDIGTVVYADEYNISGRLTEWGDPSHGVPRLRRIRP